MMSARAGAPKIRSKIRSKTGFLTISEPIGAWIRNLQEKCFTTVGSTSRLLISEAVFDTQNPPKTRTKFNQNLAFSTSTDQTEPGFAISAENASQRCGQRPDCWFLKRYLTPPKSGQILMKINFFMYSRPTWAQIRNLCRKRFSMVWSTSRLLISEAVFGA